jgi:hypothetical protein
MKELAAANSIPAYDGMKGLLANEKFQDLILKEIQAAGRKGGLTGIEIVSGVVVVHEEWTPQNVGLMGLIVLMFTGLMRYAGLIDFCVEAIPEGDCVGV